MAQASELEQQQSELLKEASGDLVQCLVCRKSKKRLYSCNFINCPQAGRWLCKKCGKMTHTDDDDSDDEEQSQHYNHTFDIKNCYVRTAESLKLELSKQDKHEIQASAREIRRLVAVRHEQGQSKERSKFELIVNFGFNSLSTVKSLGDGAGNFWQWIMENGDWLWVASEAGGISKFGDNALELAQICKEGAFTAAGVVFAVEVAYQMYRMIQGDIGLKQFAKKVAVAATVGVAGAVGNIGGAAVGGAIGTLIAPGPGTAFGSFLGGFFGSIFAGLKAKEEMEKLSWFNDKDDQEYRHKLLKEALDAFGFDFKELTNKKVFNRDELQRRYKVRAKEAHPDMKGGSEEKFLKLTSRMSMLMAILDQGEDIKEKTVREIETLAIELPGFRRF